MSKRTWDDAIKRGLDLLVNREKYCYIYGAKGILIKDRATFNALIAAEPNYFKKYSAAEIEQIYKNSVGKIAYDCSGFVGWVCTGDCQYSAGQKANSVANASIAVGPAGSILFTTFGGTGRHIGIDIGYGAYLHMGWESTDANVAAHKDSVVIWRFNQNKVAWEYSGMSNAVDYTGATNR